VRLTRQTARELAFQAAAFAAGTGGIALWHLRPVALSALLVAIAALLVAGCRLRCDALALYAIGAVVGPCGEMIGVSAGAWRYTGPTLLGIPPWLPFAWGLATVLIRGIAGTLAKIAGG